MKNNVMAAKNRKLKKENIKLWQENENARSASGRYTPSEAIRQFRHTPAY